jgi:hypothetical protein
MSKFIRRPAILVFAIFVFTAGVLALFGPKKRVSCEIVIAVVMTVDRPAMTERK